MEQQEQKLGEEEEEEEEEFVLLLPRRRHNKSTVEPPVNGGNEHAKEEPAKDKEIKYDSHAAEQNGDEVTPSFDKNSIYFDGKQGNEPADGGISGTEYAGFESSSLETNSKAEELVIMEKAFELDIQRVIRAEINHHHHKDSGGEIFPCSSPSLAEEYLCDENSTNLEHLDNKAGADIDVNLVEEVDQEFNGSDVERVVEKQTTHDLYCPDCSTCITKRVILRRRKRRVRNIRRKSKHDNCETDDFASSGNAVYAANDKHDDTLNIYSNDSPTAAAEDDENLFGQPEIFRCLSCIGIFIPKGNGFKLLRVSGDRNENEEMPDVQHLPPSKTNWLFPIFPSDNRKPAINQGDINPIHFEVDGIQTPARDANIKIQKPLTGIEQEINIPMDKGTLCITKETTLISSAAHEACQVGMKSDHVLVEKTIGKDSAVMIPDMGPLAYSQIVDISVHAVMIPDVGPLAYSQNVDVSVNAGCASIYHESDLHVSSEEGESDGNESENLNSMTEESSWLAKPYRMLRSLFKRPG